MSVRGYIMSAVFDPLDYLTLAGNLQNSKDECELRTALSRAYYAIYLKWFDDVNIKLGNPPNAYLKHKYFRRYIKGHHPDKLAQSIIVSLWENRRMADYFIVDPKTGLPPVVNSPLVKKAVADAHTLHGLMPNLR